MSRLPAVTRRSDAGFTLLDLLLALLVAGLVFGLAVPAWTNAVARVRAGAARTAITATLFNALRNATVIGREVVVCPATGDQCIGGSDWSRGWIAFVDVDGDRLHGATETVIDRASALPRGVRLTGSSGRPRIVYQPYGSNAGSNITFTLCDRRGPDDALALILSNGGRLRADRPTRAAAATCAAGL